MILRSTVWLLDFISKTKQFRAMVTIDDQSEVLHGLFHRTHFWTLQTTLSSELKVTFVFFLAFSRKSRYLELRRYAVLCHQSADGGGELSCGLVGRYPRYNWCREERIGWGQLLQPPLYTPNQNLVTRFSNVIRLMLFSERERMSYITLSWGIYFRFIATRSFTNVYRTWRGVIYRSELSYFSDDATSS